MNDEATNRPDADSREDGPNQGHRPRVDAAASTATNTSRRSAVARATRRYLFHVFWRTAAVAVILVAASVSALFGAFRQLSVTKITDEITSSLLLRDQMLSSFHAWAVPSLTSVLNDPIIKSAIYGSTHSVVDLVDAVQRLQHVAGNNPLIHSLYCYNPTAGLVLSSHSGVERERITDPDLVSVVERSLDYDAVAFIPRTIVTRSGYFAAGLSDDGPSERVLTMVFFDRQFHRSPTEGALVANLSEERLRRMFMEETAAANSRFLVVNDAGVALSHYDPEYFGEEIVAGTPIEAFVDSSQEVRTDTVAMDQGEHLVVSVSRSGTGRHLLSVTDTRELTAEIADLRDSVILILVLVVVLVIPASFLVARQVSRPVARIVDRAAQLLPEVGAKEDERDGASGTTDNSEIGYLDHVLNRLGRRVRELDRQVEERRTSGERDALRHVIEGTHHREASGDDLPEELREADAWVVVVVRFDRYSDLLEAVDGAMLRSMFETIGEMIGETFGNGIRFVDFGGDHAVVVHPVSADSEAGVGLNDEYRRIVNRIRSTLGRSITVGVSVKAAEVAKLPSAYHAALRATDHRFRYGAGHVIRFDQLDADEGDYRFPREVVLHMLETLRLGKTGTAKRMLEQVIGDAKLAPFEEYRFAVQMLVRMIHRELLDRIPGTVGTDRTIRGLTDEVARADTAGEVYDSFARAFELFGERMDSDREQRNQVIVHRARSIVQERVTDPNLSVDSVAEQVGLSTNYLRDLFKATTGTSLSVLILTRRMELAKQLLTTTTRSVKEIASGAGFQSYNYFFTAFKRETGMTPRQYRMNRSDRNGGVQ